MRNKRIIVFCMLFCVMNMFAFEVKLSERINNKPFYYASQVMWYADNNGLICIFKTGNIYYKNNNMENLVEIANLDKLFKFSTSYLKYKCYTTDKLNNYLIEVVKEDSEVEASFLLYFEKNNWHVENITSSSLNFQKKNEIGVNFEDDNSEELKFGYSIYLERLPDLNYAYFPLLNRYAFLIKNGDGTIVFDYNKWRVDKEELKPVSYYNSLSQEKFYDEAEKQRALSVRPGFTGIKGVVAVNSEKNEVAVIFNDYNADDRALLVFQIIYDGILNDSRVRVRSEPNLKCETLDYVNKGDSVKILDRSTDKQQIGDMNDYWYNVELQNGTKGWVYGAYIDSL